MKIFFFLTVLSMAFSMSVILSTIGLMDGYENILKEGLRKNSSDMEIINEFGFFEIDEDFRSTASKFDIKSFTGIIRTEGFVIGDSSSRGVLINGIKVEEFSKVSPLKIAFENDESTVIGIELAKELGVKVGDEITIAFTRGNQNFENLPYVKRFLISGIVKHGVYKKDSRIIYVDRDYLERFANASGKINTCLVKVNHLSNEQIQTLSTLMNDSMSHQGFKVKPYWSDFSRLLEAVQVEKFSITIILQLIVIISLFNIVAFINFSTIKKSSEFFLLRALGMSFKFLYSFWAKFILLIWGLSSILSLFFAQVFDKFILKSSFLKIPGSIYELEHLSLKLGMKSIVFVFSLTLIWCILIIFNIIYREKGKSLLQGLKREYA